MIVKIINTSTNELPAYQTAGAAGLDIRATAYACAYGVVFGNSRRLRSASAPA